MSVDPLAAIRTLSVDIAEQFADRHDPAAVEQFVQFTLIEPDVDEHHKGVYAGTHPLDIMRISARMAAINAVDEDKVETVASEMLADEDLCRTIIDAKKTTIEKEIN